jgi:NADH:ubiquinone oxidoreductase subunit 4 (subunit M)
MLLLSLLTLPLLGVFIISADLENFPFQSKSIENKKKIALFISIVNFLLCLFIFIFFDFSYNQFQFVLEPHSVSEYPFYLGLDGISSAFFPNSNIKPKVSSIKNRSITTNPYTPFI